MSALTTRLQRVEAELAELRSSASSPAVVSVGEVAGPRTTVVRYKKVRMGSLPVAKTAPKPDDDD